MAKNETVRIRPATLQADKDALAAISDYKAPAYKPANDKFTLDKLEAAEAAMKAAQVVEVQKQNEADSGLPHFEMLSFRRVASVFSQSAARMRLPRIVSLIV